MHGDNIDPFTNNFMLPCFHLINLFLFPSKIVMLNENTEDNIFYPDGRREDFVTQEGGKKGQIILSEYPTATLRTIN